MKPRDLADLIALAAIWGGAFLFGRIAAPEFGPFPLAFLRVAGASLILLPLLASRGQLPLLQRHWPALLVVGVCNSALPFALFGYAAISISAGLGGILNATAPLFAALIGALWLRERLNTSRTVGLALGFLGVLGLAWDKASFKPGAEAVGYAMIACIVAAALYGWSANFAKRLQAVPSLVMAAGSQLSAALVLVLPAFWWWPSTPPGLPTWGAVAALALLCTGVAYILYFRLIANTGATNTITVTFLIPLFAMLWGGLFLGEQVTLVMAIGCAVICAGTALTTGLLARAA